MAQPLEDEDDQQAALKFINASTALVGLLEKPDIRPALAELKKVKDTSLGNLLGFMHAFNLRFGAASTLKEKQAYQQLYGILDQTRDQILSEAKLEPTSQVATRVRLLPELRRLESPAWTDERALTRPVIAMIGSIGSIPTIRIGQLDTRRGPLGRIGRLKRTPTRRFQRVALAALRINDHSLSVSSKPEEAGKFGDGLDEMRVGVPLQFLAAMSPSSDSDDQSAARVAAFFQVGRGISNLGNPPRIFHSHPPHQLQDHVGIGPSPGDLIAADGRVDRTRSLTSPAVRGSRP